jgi:hypothetical protein
MKNKSVRIIALIVFILLLGVSLFYTVFSNNEIALVDTEFYGWAVNEDNPSQMYFAYEVHNYGEQEAKNVSVECLIRDFEGNKIFSSIQNIGNIASHSISYSEFYPIDSSLESKITSNSTAVCYVESCDNCKILYKEIPELVEFYEG